MLRELAKPYIMLDSDGRVILDKSINYGKQ